MLRQYELVERVKAYDPDADEELLNRAYVFSVKAHGSQLRASGDPYFSHPVEVAGILTDLKLDDETIATAILHDTIEDTVATSDDIARLFGPNIHRLVDGVTKLSRIEAQTDTERAAENLRKFLVAMSGDIRVLLVKLADRLHNMRTLHHIKSAEKRRRIARETLDIYAPLAGRIGMYEFMEEMEELAFREVEPEAWQTIQRRLEALRERGGDLIERVARLITETLGRAGVGARVLGREKRPFSIWRKMQRRHMAFEQLSDVIAFRVIVERDEDCYRALGALHQRWPMVPGRFKDFISTPRKNGYRSLHTTLVQRDTLRVEIQIRTEEMHREAELGVAAHWAYKQGLNGQDPAQHYPWVKDLLDVLEHAESAEELIEHTRLGLYQDQVFCFTPKGELIQLPVGATPVDFAYEIHTSLGDTAVGAKVNGRQVTLRERLSNGDQVEILRSTTAHPDPAWENFVVTAKAQAAVRKWKRHKERDEQIALGAKLYHQLKARLKVSLSEEAVVAGLKRLRLHDMNALFVALAKQTIPDDQVLDALVPGSRVAQLARRRRKASAEDAIPIRGLTPGMAVSICDHCLPVPGDRIVGLRRPGVGIEVHAIDCALLADLDGAGDWIDLGWGVDAETRVARLAASVANEPGSLARLTGVIAEHGGNIVNVRTRDRDRASHTYVIDVEVDNLAHLTAILATLRAARGILSAERARG
jgi:RelA/SpoT family (p)ppGpp synthetase